MVIHVQLKMLLLVCMKFILNNSLIRGFLEKAIDSPLIHIIYMLYQ